MHKSIAKLIMCAMSVIILLGGCAARLPIYPRMSNADTLALVVQQREQVRTVQSSCEIVMTDAAGQTVVLDGAMVIAFPDKARLRAWKFGQAVFDLTLANDETYLFVASDRAKSAFDAQSSPARGMQDALRLFSADFFRDAAIDSEATTATTLAITNTGDSQTPVHCFIDRKTLTPTRYTLSANASLTLDRYAMINQVAWASRWTLVSPQGRLVIKTTDPVFGGEIAPSTFTPPQRARKIP